MFTRGVCFCFLLLKCEVLLFIVVFFFFWVGVCFIFVSYDLGWPSREKGEAVVWFTCLGDGCLIQI